MKGVISYSSPTNISLVKNFGSFRKRVQGSPTISMTLEKSRSETVVRYHYDEGKTLKLVAKINGRDSEYLNFRTQQWFNKAIAIYPWIQKTAFEIDVLIDASVEPFVGIYTAMCSLAFCVAEIAGRFGKFDQKINLQTISSLALLDSENAARSVYAGFVSLGKSDAIQWSSDKYATPYQRRAMIYEKLQDTIIIFNDGKIDIPNPDLLTEHFYMEVRQRHAQLNFTKFTRALDEGQWDVFEQVTENEALTFAGLLLSLENSQFFPDGAMIDTIRKLRNFRNDCQCPIAFSIDREMRLHLIYPPIAQKSLLQEIPNIIPASALVLHDYIGKGPYKIKDEIW